MTKEIKDEILNRLYFGDPVKEINKICDEMLTFARTASTVVNDEIDYDALAEEQAQQDAYESGRVFH